MAFTSADKFDIEITEIPEFESKLWVRVRFRNGAQWIPSFEDLYRIIRAIGECEDFKYPPELGYKGRWMVADFVAAALRAKDWAELRDKYRIPDRSNQPTPFIRPERFPPR